MTKTTLFSDLTFHVLPADQGQIVELSYAADYAAGCLVCCIHDRSDRSERFQAAALDQTSETEFEPQNGQLPDHGDWIDVCGEDEIEQGGLYAETGIAGVLAIAPADAAAFDPSAWEFLDAEQRKDRSGLVELQPAWRCSGCGAAVLSGAADVDDNGFIRCPGCVEADEQND